MSILPELARERRVIAFDQPGHGDSERPKKRMGLGEHAAALHAALEAIGARPVTLVGHSWGGAVALQFAADYPDAVRGLVLVSPYLASWRALDPVFGVIGVPVLGTAIIRVVCRPVTKLFDPRVFFEGSFYPEKVPYDYAKNELARSMRTEAFRSNSMDMAAVGSDIGRLERRYASFGGRIVVLNGNRDLLTPLARNRKKIEAFLPNAELRVLEGAGHMPLFSRPAEILAAMREVSAS